jgi:PTS system glucitol/sorbitol-specific IIA component
VTVLYETTIKEIGPEAADLLEGGVLILFRVGAPRELAEVAVLHEPTVRSATAPAPSDMLMIGNEKMKITAVGETAWKKVQDMDHVVFSFNGATEVQRPGEICVEAIPGDRLKSLITVNGQLAVFSAR